MLAEALAPIARAEEERSRQETERYRLFVAATREQMRLVFALTFAVLAFAFVAYLRRDISADTIVTAFLAFGAGYSTGKSTKSEG